MTEYNRTESARSLLVDIEEWCAATATRETSVGHVLFLHPGFVGLMRLRLTVTEEKEAAVRKFMADNPVGWRALLPKTHANGTQPVGRASSPLARRQEVEAKRRIADEEAAETRVRVHRDPCPRCGARGDINCGHSPVRLGVVL